MPYPSRVLHFLCMRLCKRLSAPLCRAAVVPAETSFHGRQPISALCHTYRPRQSSRRRRRRRRRRRGGRGGGARRRGEGGRGRRRRRRRGEDKVEEQDEEEEKEEGGSGGRKTKKRTRRRTTKKRTRTKQRTASKRKRRKKQRKRTTSRSRLVPLETPAAESGPRGDDGVEHAQIEWWPTHGSRNDTGAGRQPRPTTLRRPFRLAAGQGIRDRPAGGTV